MTICFKLPLLIGPNTCMLDIVLILIMVITISLEEILDETNQLDVSGKTRQWLQQEALNHNPKIEVNFFELNHAFLMQ